MSLEDDCSGILVLSKVASLMFVDERVVDVVTLMPDWPSLAFDSLVTPEVDPDVVSTDVVISDVLTVKEVPDSNIESLTVAVASPVLLVTDMLSDCATGVVAGEVEI